MKLNHRIAFILLFSAYFAIGYLGIQQLTAAYLTPLTLELPGEAHIPFLPFTFIIYLSVYLFLPAVFLVTDKKEHHIKTLLVFFVALNLHFFLFMFLPVEYRLRPDLTSMMHNPMLLPIAQYYTVDYPLNCFPSIHVSFAFLSYFCIRSFKPSLSTVYLIAAIAISLSTIFVKQHYVLDVVAAILLSAFMNRFFIEKDFFAPQTENS